MKEWSEGKKECYFDFIEQMLKDGYIKKPRKKAQKAPDFNPEGFDVIYGEYPRKTNRTQAQQAWNKLRPDKELTTKMYKHFSVAYKTTKKEYIPHFSTYLNNARWNDEIIESEPELLKIPTDDNELEPFARKHGLRLPTTETYFQYRQVLKKEIEEKQIKTLQ